MSELMFYKDVTVLKLAAQNKSKNILIEDLAMRSENSRFRKTSILICSRRNSNVLVTHRVRTPDEIMASGHILRDSLRNLFSCQPTQVNGRSHTY